MGDVRVAGLAPLWPVLLLGDVVGVLQQGEIGLGVQVAVHRGERLEHLLDGRRALGGDPACQSRAHAPGS